MVIEQHTGQKSINHSLSITDNIHIRKL